VTPAPVVADAAVAADPAAIPAPLAAEVEAAIGLLEAITTAAESVGAADDEHADCEAMAAAMRPIADGPSGKAIVTIDADPDAKVYGKAIAETYGPRLDGASDRLAAAINACMYDPGVGQVLIDTGMIHADGD
jgi:hypothetical protein